MRSFSDSYKAAGVDIEAGYRGVQLMRADVERTRIPGVLGGIGGFGGLFAPDLSAYQEPILVSGTDGVGTKIRLAQLLDKHDTVGIDCVAMCVNDIVCCGAKPLFFLDYIAIGRNVPEKVAALVSGVAEGCVLAGCALLGGETAEHPGVMDPEDYDLAGFAVGLADRPRMVDHSAMRIGDILLALPSTGLHANGFSLVRKVLDVEHRDLGAVVPELCTSLGDALLTPTAVYVQPILRCLEAVRVKGISHITGGGFYENLPRCLPEGLSARIDKSAVQTPAIFRLLQREGDIPEREMFNTFNMGVGMVVIVSPSDADRAAAALDCGAYPIGEIVPGDREVLL